jgi:hypothetical protein
MAKLTKNKDIRFNGNHPNSIDEGYTKVIETIPATPIVGERYRFGSLLTSIVESILIDDEECCIFKTENSYYTIDKLWTP